MQSQAIRADTTISSGFFQPIMKTSNQQLIFTDCDHLHAAGIVLDRLFVTFIFPVYENVLPRPDQLSWLNIDAGYS